MMLKQNVSVSPNHFFLTCQNETFVHVLIFFANTVGSCIFQWTYPFEECHSTLKITIHIELPLLPHYVSCKRAKCEFLTRELVRLQSWPIKPEKAQCQLKGSKCSSTFLQPSPGSHSAGQCYEPQSGGLSCCLWRAHIWGSNQSSQPLTCVQISPVILIKAACLNQSFWEMLLMIIGGTLLICRTLGIKKTSASFLQGSSHKIMDTPWNLWVLQSQKFCVRNHETEISLYTALRKELPRKAGRQLQCLGWHFLSHLS